MELEEAIEKLSAEMVEYSNIAENVLEGKGKVAEDCREYVGAINVVLNHLTKQEKMIELMAIKIKKQINCYDPCWLEYEDDNIKCYGQEKCKECIKQYFEKKTEEAE